MVLNPRLKRRELLAYGAVGAAALLVQPKSWAASSAQLPPYNGPNVILIRFGGGVRRRETIAPDHTYAPFLRHVVAQRGTLLRKWNWIKSKK